MEMLDEQNVQGKTVVISTHDVELAYRWADEVVLLDAGRVVRQGSPEMLFSDEDDMRRTRIKLPILLDLFSEMVERGLVDIGRMPPEGIPGDDRLNRGYDRKKGEAQPWPDTHLGCG